MTGDTVRDAGATLRSKYADLRTVLAAGAITELEGIGRGTRYYAKREH